MEFGDVEFCVCGILRVEFCVCGILRVEFGVNFLLVEFVTCGILYLWNLGVVPFVSFFELATEIAKCANDLIPYPYIDDIKIAENCAQRRVIDCLNAINQEKFERIKIGFSPNLLKQIIVRQLVYIDKDMVENKI